MPHLLKNLGLVDFSRDGPSRTESDSTQQRPVRNHATGNRESPSPLRQENTGRAAIEPGSAHIRIRDTMNRADRYIY